MDWNETLPFPTHNKFAAEVENIMAKGEIAHYEYLSL